MRACHLLNLGVVDYLQAWQLQKELLGEVAEGRRPGALLLLQHPHCYTMGRRAPREHVLLSDEELRRRGIAVYETDRGGQVTYHGPGQLVAYPIIPLRGWGGPLKYVRALERAMIGALADHDIDAQARPGLTGVWVGRDKIGAIGVKVSRGVTCHGLSLNVDPDLSRYRDVIPCGNETGGVTSMARLLGQPLNLDTVAYSLQYHLGRELSLRLEEREKGAALHPPLLRLTGGV